MSHARATVAPLAPDHAVAAFTRLSADWERLRCDPADPRYWPTHHRLTNLLSDHGEQTTAGGLTFAPDRCGSFTVLNRPRKPLAKSEYSAAKVHRLVVPEWSSRRAVTGETWAELTAEEVA